MVILCGDELYEIEREAECQAAAGEKLVVCFSTEAIFVALKEAESFGARVILCGEFGKRATLHFDPQPCRCGFEKQARGDSSPA